MLNSIIRFVRDEEGASAIEYGLLVGIIGLVLVVALGLTSDALSTLFSTTIPNAVSGAGTS